jgi:PIN domain nuclease of toxin-antitoxin system
MKYLLDTHALIWFLEGDSQLSSKAKNIIVSTDNQILISIASLWEMAIKMSIGKLNLSQNLELIIQRLEEEYIEILPIEVEHILKIQTLEFHHKDPFDRIIIAQSLIEGTTLVSIEDIFDNYKVQRLW